jgi:hypothetical protein
MAWIVPRYPVYPPGSVVDPKQGGSAAKIEDWMRTSAKPGKPSTWETFAFEHQPAGPKAPRGVSEWAAWQFSAGFNRQGSTYGVSSRDLDLNIVDPTAWARWTLGTPGTSRVAPSPPTPAVNTLHAGEQLLPGGRRVGSEGTTVLTHQPDGNVVLTVGGQPVWDTRSAGKRTKTFIMQGDGNLVLYSTNGRALWDSRTVGHPGAELFVRGPQLEIHASNGPLLWSSTSAPHSTPSVTSGPGGTRKITVLPGEGWFQVARRAGIGGSHWPKLAAVNGGRDRVLHPGDVLVLP